MAPSIRNLFILLACTTLLELVGCATIPAPLAGDNFAAVTPQQATTQNIRGERVRWGGEIIKVEPKPESTCFEVLSRGLYADARPNRRDRSDGRFIACGKGFYDPAEYTKGRDLTVVGSLTGTEQRHVGEYNYTFAHVDAEQLYMWPRYQRPEYYDPWSTAYYGPYWRSPYWSGWWGFAGPPIVIVHAPPPKP